MASSFLGDVGLVSADELSLACWTGFVYFWRYSSEREGKRGANILPLAPDSPFTLYSHTPHACLKKLLNNACLAG